jgi:hypothetical protein
MRQTQRLEPNHNRNDQNNITDAGRDVPKDRLSAGRPARRQDLRQAGVFLVALLLCAVFSLAPLGQAAPYNTGTQNVSGTRTTPQYGDTNLVDNAGNRGPFGPYGWSYSYTRSFDGTRLTKDVEIKFQFDTNFVGNQGAYISGAIAAVGGIWNNKFLIRDTANNTTFPLVFNLTTNGPFNQTVQVHANQNREDMLNWGANSTAPTMAHEFGHMLGLYDEYIGGAVNQYPNPTLSNDGLMGLGALNANPVMYPRYYQQLLDYMNTLNPGGSFQLQAVPEPASSLLCFIAIGFLMAGRMRRMAVGGRRTAGS